MVTLTCRLCGSTFETHKRYRQFCGRGCSQKAISRKRWGSDVPMIDRLMARVVKTETCWLWTGPKNKPGYGATAWANSPEPIASRLSWHLLRGPIPEGLMILHHCDNPPCVNPDHLFLGNKSDNAKDHVNKGRMRHLHRRNAHGQWVKP